MTKIYVFDKNLFFILLMIIPMMVLLILIYAWLYFQTKDNKFLILGLFFVLAQALGSIALLVVFRRNRAIIIENRMVTYHDRVLDSPTPYFVERKVDKSMLKGIRRESFFNNRIIYYIGDERKEIAFACGIKTYTKIKELLNLL